MKGTDSVAQLVEQYTFNVRVLGSNPSGITAKSPILETEWGFFVVFGGFSCRFFSGRDWIVAGIRKSPHPTVIIGWVRAFRYEKF